MCQLNWYIAKEPKKRPKQTWTSGCTRQSINRFNKGYSVKVHLNLDLWDDMILTVYKQISDQMPRDNHSRRERERERENKNKKSQLYDKFLDKFLVKCQETITSKLQERGEKKLSSVWHLDSSWPFLKAQLTEYTYCLVLHPLPLSVHLQSALIFWWSC